MKTYQGKTILKNGINYPVTVIANSLREANQKVNKSNTTGLSGRFHVEKLIYLTMKTQITLQYLPFIIGGVVFITIVAIWLFTYIQTIPA